MKKIVKDLGVFTVLVVLFILVGCQEKHSEFPEISSTTCGNIVMGNGVFAYENGFIYFIDLSNIYEYDMETGKTIVFKSQSSMIRSLYTQGQYVYFASSGLNRITKDGKKVEKVFERKGGCIQLFVDGTDAYYLDGIEGSMYHRDLGSDEETEILSNKMLAYYVDDENIYAVARIDSIPYLFISGREVIDFKVEELPFTPITVFAANECLYMAERGSYQIMKYSPEGVEILPIYSTYYQVIDDKVIYLDSKTFEDNCFSLAIYDMTTGESSTIYENVFDFCVFGNEFICIQQNPIPSEKYLLYNLKTGEISVMYGEGE